MSTSATARQTELNKYSKHLTSDPTQPAAQAMLYGIGLNRRGYEKSAGGRCQYGLRW